MRRGSRVRLRPRAGADVFDLALAGRVAVVDSIEEDTEGAVHLVVTVEDDPGRDLGAARSLGHRFFFAPAEVEPLPGEPAAAAPPRRVLVAGIGNVFLGDDGFGVALADRLARRALPAGVDVVDFGIRGMDLAYALGEGYDAGDAARRRAARRAARHAVGDRARGGRRASRAVDAHAHGSRRTCSRSPARWAARRRARSSWRASRRPG